MANQDDKTQPEAAADEAVEGDALAPALQQALERAVEHHGRGQLEEAEALYREILAGFPTDPDAHNRLGRALMELGHYQAARQSYQEALELDPNHTQAEFNLAYALINQSQTNLPQAIELLEGLAQRRPDYTEVFYRLGEAYRFYGKKEKAAEWYSRYVKVGNHRSLLQQANQQLRSMKIDQPSAPTSP